MQIENQINTLIKELHAEIETIQSNLVETEFFDAEYDEMDNLKRLIEDEKAKYEKTNSIVKELNERVDELSRLVQSNKEEQRLIDNEVAQLLTNNGSLTNRIELLKRETEEAMRRSVDLEVQIEEMEARRYQKRRRVEELLAVYEAITDVFVEKEQASRDVRIRINHESGSELFLIGSEDGRYTVRHESDKDEFKEACVNFNEHQRIMSFIVAVKACIEEKRKCL